MTHRSLWPVTTIHRHQPRIIMFNSFYLGPKSNSRGESGRCFSYLFIIFFFSLLSTIFCVLNTYSDSERPHFHIIIICHYLVCCFCFVIYFFALLCFDVFAVSIAKASDVASFFSIMFFSFLSCYFEHSEKTRNNQPLNLRHIHITYSPLYRVANTPFEPFCKLMNHTASAQALQHGCQLKTALSPCYLQMEGGGEEHIMQTSNGSTGGLTRTYAHTEHAEHMQTRTLTSTGRT